VKNNVFLGTRIPRPWNLVVFLEIDKNEEEPIEDGVGAQKRIGKITNIAKSKILIHFLKGKISFSILETVLTIPGELDYLEGLVKLARRCKDEKNLTSHSHCCSSCCTHHKMSELQ